MTCIDEEQQPRLADALHTAWSEAPMSPYRFASVAEEIDAIQAAQDGCENALGLLVSAYTPKLRKSFQRHRSALSHLASVGEDDLRQVLLAAFVEAVMVCPQGQQVKCRVFMLDNAATTAINDANTLSIAKRTAARAQAVLREHGFDKASAAEAMRDNDVASGAHITRETFMAAADAMSIPESLDAAVQGSEDALVSVFSRGSAEMCLEDKVLLDAAMGSLTEEERAVLLELYGFNGLAGDEQATGMVSTRRCAENLGITRDAAQRLHASAISKARAALGLVERNPCDPVVRVQKQELMKVA